MIEQVKVSIEKQLDERPPNLLLAISGGVDSMVLWHLVHKLRFSYAVAHFNYKLRGEDSKKDQELIENQAKESKVKLYTHEVDTKVEAEERSESVQMYAREVRYSWFEELKKKHGFTHVLTAHHLDDSIETFFINLNRGTGIKGLKGIVSGSEVIRPLLNFSKDEIYDFAKSNKVKFREDLSNQKTDYLRNWFRLELLPVWYQKNPGFKKQMRENLMRFAAAEKIIQEAIERDLKVAREEMEDGFVSLLNIRSMKYPKESLGELWKDHGIHYSQIDRLLESIDNEEVGKMFKSSSHIFNLDRDAVFIEEINYLKSEVEVFLNSPEEEVIEPISIRLHEVSSNNVDFAKENTLYLDMKKLTFPLRLRKWKYGDRMKPLGMSGSKKVSDILIDAKVPLIEKDEVYVLQSGKYICALIGFGIDERFKLDQESKINLEISWKQ